MAAITRNPNKTLRDRIVWGAMSAWFGIPAAVAGTTALATGNLEIGVITGMGPLVGISVIVMATIMTISHDPTIRAPATIDPVSVKRMMERLVSMATRGLRSEERHDAQRDVDRGIEQMTILLGKDPWIAVEDENPAEAPEHMEMRAERISQSMDLAEWSASRIGHDRKEYVGSLAGCLAAMVAIIRDFGLDPRGMVPGTRRLPGQDLGAPVPLPLLAAPVRTLADEWLNGDNAGVPEMERIVADTAATRELKALEADWARARATSEPENVDAVDASFRIGVDRISATLSEAITLRARKDRDQLSTNVRYLDAKHA